MHITLLPVELILDIIHNFRFADEQFAPRGRWSWYNDEWQNWWNPRSKDSEISDSHGLSTLLAFSRTNRYFRGICIPLIYSRMAVTTVKDFYTAMERREFVQVLRVRLASRYAIKENPTLVNDGQILTILETFTNLNTLVLLYDCNMRIHRRTPVDMTTAAVSSKVVSLLNSGRLKTLAVSIHSGIYGTKDNPRTVAPTTLLTELLGKGLSLSSQQTIHMALHLAAMPEHSLDQKITYRTGKNALMKTVRPFSPSPNLVSMHLYKCRDIRAQHLPELVLRCPKLQYLYVASVGGSRSEVQTPRRSPGWSERHDAFWRQREPLKVIHLEGVLDWQICAMGTIAAFVVTMTCISRHELNNAFLKDSEIFPCMKELRCEPTYDIPIRYKEYPWTLKEVMEQRQVVMRPDATRSNSWNRR